MGFVLARTKPHRLPFRIAQGKKPGPLEPFLLPSASNGLATSPAVTALIKQPTFWTAALDAGKSSGKLPFLSLDADADCIQHDLAGCR